MKAGDFSITIVIVEWLQTFYAISYQVNFASNSYLRLMQHGFIMFIGFNYLTLLYVKEDYIGNNISRNEL